MYRGRGPSKATSANVQCQKCLKRGHYSYECKAAAQERPYVPRPSRTQQLFNPKLLPKLQNAVPEGLEKKKGVADQELAKKEAERDRKRELEMDEENSDRGSPPPRRRRSVSYDSVSSISTRSPSPAPKRSLSPPPRNEGSRDSRKFSPPVPQNHGRSLSPEDRYSRGPSESPERRHQGHRSPYSRSPSPRRSPSPPRWGHDHDHDRGSRATPSGRGYERDSYARRAHSRSRSRSRSPARSPVQREGRNDDRARYYRDRDDDSYQRGGNAPPQQQPLERQPRPPRERSLSPFSKRLALTQAMNK